MKDIHAAPSEEGTLFNNVVQFPTRTEKSYEPLNEAKNDFDAEYIGRQIAVYTIDRIESDSDDALCALIDGLLRISHVAKHQVRDAAFVGFAIIAFHALLRGVQEIQGDRDNPSSDVDQHASPESGVSAVLPEGEAL